MREKSFIKHQVIGRSLSVAITCLRKNADKFESAQIQKISHHHHQPKMMSAKIISLNILILTLAVTNGNAQLQFVEVANENWQPESKDFAIN